MRYSDGNEAKLGDVVLIGGKHMGVVVASIDTGEYAPEHPEEQWAYLGKGVMVNTDFGGLVHYADAGKESIVLTRRHV